MTEKSPTSEPKGHLGDDVVGAQIRALRGEAGLSLRALAPRIGVSPATLSQIENGRAGISVRRLQRIADALNITVATILDTVISGPQTAEQPASALRLSGGPPPIGSTWRLYEPLRFDPVLRAALQEFLHIGYHGATVREIATRAGFSVSGIYHYYSSKQHMLVSLLEYTMAELLERSTAARDEGRDPVERFCFLIEHLALFHTHRADLGFVGAAEKRSLDPANERKIADLRTAQSAMVYIEVEAAMRAGHFTEDMPHERSRAIVTMCTALPTWWRPGGPCTPEQIADQYVTIALDLMMSRT